MGPGCETRTDLVTSSNQRSASDGVRRWDGTTGDEGGGMTITGVGAPSTEGGVDQSPPGRPAAAAPAGVVAQGLVSRAGRAGDTVGGRASGITGGLVGPAEKAGEERVTGAAGD